MIFKSQITVDQEEMKVAIIEFVKRRIIIKAGEEPPEYKVDSLSSMQAEVHVFKKNAETKEQNGDLIGELRRNQ